MGISRHFDTKNYACEFRKFFLSDFLDLKCLNTHRPKFVNTLRPKYVNSSCNIPVRFRYYRKDLICSNMQQYR